MSDFKRIDKPTAPGWYWHSGPNYGNPNEEWPLPRPIKVWAEDGELTMARQPWGIQGIYTEHHRWWGPAIEEPVNE